MGIAILFLGRIVFAIVLTVLGFIFLLWLPAEEIGSVSWAYKALLSFQKSLPYLIWGALIGVFATTPPQWRYWILLICFIGLWAHVTNLGIFYPEYWQHASIVTPVWLTVFLPLTLSMSYWIAVFTKLYSKITEQAIRR